MDFSFVGSDAGLQRKQPAGDPPQQQKPAAAAAAPAAAAGGLGRAIAVPSFRQVQQAGRQRTDPMNMFRPSGSSAPSQHQQVNPYAFIGGPGGAPPPAQQQQPQQPQQQQYQPPAVQQQQQQQSQPRYAPHPQQQQPPQQQRPGFQQPRPPPQQWQQAPPQQQQQQQQQAYQQQQAQQAQQQAFPANSIIVNRKQQGNPVLKYIRNVRWQFGDVVPDYLLGRETACLFLSLRYHLLKPDYIHSRIKELQRSFRLRVVLCHVDTEDAVEPLAQVTRAAIGNECTLICGWSNPECARYLETFKSYENKPAEVIQKDLGTDYLSRINAALTSVRGVNRTDVKTLGDRFGSVAGVFQASAEELQACPGIGPTKARRLFDTFHQPFRRAITATPTAAAAAGTGTATGAAGEAVGTGTAAGAAAGAGTLAGAAAADAASGTAAAGAQQAQQQVQQQPAVLGGPVLVPAELQELGLGDIEEEEEENGDGVGVGREDVFEGSDDDFL